MSKCFTSQKPQTFNSSNKFINLTPELEPLRNIILLQHTALETHIKELGNICFNLTTIIEKKKENSLLQECVCFFK